MPWERSPSIPYVVVNITTTPSVDGCTRLAVALAHDVSDALKTHMNLHDVSEMAATVHAIAALHAVDAHLAGGQQLCAFRRRTLWFPKVVSFEFTWDVDRTPSDTAKPLNWYPFLDIRIPSEAGQLIKAYRSKHAVSTTETMRRAIATLITIDEYLLHGWRIGACHRAPGRLEVTDLLFTFTLHQAQVSAALGDLKDHLRRRPQSDRTGVPE